METEDDVFEDVQKSENGEVRALSPPGLVDVLDDAKNVPSFDSSADSSSGFLKFYSETRPTSRFVFESSSKASSIKCLIGSSEMSSKSSFWMENIYFYEIV